METAETLKEKIDLLGLSEEEREKLEEKFAPSLSYVSIDEMKAVLDVLARKGEKITKAREVKVLTNPASKIEKNYDFIEEAHEPNIYAGNILLLSCPVVDIFKRINYCRQYNIPYKNEDGTYKEFLFKEGMFQHEVNGLAPAMTDPVEEMTPLEENDTINVTVPEVEIENNPTDNEVKEPQDVNDYMQAEADLNDIESQTTTFAQIKQDLEAQLAELDALRSQSDYDNDNVYRFNDIEQETYNVGRGRAA